MYKTHNCGELRASDAGKTVVLETNGAADISVVPASENIIISMDVNGLSCDLLSCPGPQHGLKTVSQLPAQS